jgi:hypothetical protein
MDPKLLFQRLTTGKPTGQLEELFKHELCSYPPALWQSRLIVRAAQTPALIDTMSVLISDDDVGSEDQSQYALDGDSLSHRTHGSVASSTMTSAGSTQTTLLENVDMPSSYLMAMIKNCPLTIVLAFITQLDDKDPLSTSWVKWSWNQGKKISWSTKSTIH